MNSPDPLGWFGEADRATVRLTPTPGEDRQVERLNTSTRAVPPRETLRRARAWADMAGILSVRDITAMDSLGVPIFVSERGKPAAHRYAFGKGLLPIEAEVGAYMEAIESYFSEPAQAGLETRYGSARDLSGIPPGCDPILDFAPKFGRLYDPDAPLLLARATDAESGEEGWVPAELACNPAPPGIGASLFGTSSNGLASGNHVQEASIHALHEVIERDIWSLEFVRNRAVRVDEQDLPDRASAIAEIAASNGLRLVINHVPNDYGIPFFAVFLFDPDRPDSRFFNGGWGCHPDRTVALMRAVTEAAQSRLAFRLGLRDIRTSATAEGETDRLRRHLETLSARSRSIRFLDISDEPQAGTLDAQWAAALRCLRRVIDRPVYRIVYTPPESPLHVVRLIVPRIEHFTRSASRMGIRLRAELEAAARAG